MVTSLATPKMIGPYQVVGRIGRGGSGVVFHAQRTSDGKDVAVKWLRPDQNEDPVQRARFRREIAFLSAYRLHPHILHFVDAGVHEGSPFCVTEYVPGGALDRKMRAGFRPRRVDSLTIAMHLLSALQYLHEHRVVHRDVKLSNVLMREDGRVVLGDFGTARHDGLSTITHQGAGGLGTEGYCAPEQFSEPRDVGPPADLFGVGAILYRLVTRQRPRGLEFSEFDGSVLDVLPASLRPLVARATRHDPRNRYQTANQMAVDVSRVLRDEEALAFEPAPAVDSSSLETLISQGEPPTL